MELMYQHTLPCVVENVVRICSGAKPLSSHRGALGSVAEVLVLTVVQFHRSL